MGNSGDIEISVHTDKPEEFEEENQEGMEALDEGVSVRDVAPMSLGSLGPVGGVAGLGITVYNIFEVGENEVYFGKRSSKNMGAVREKCAKLLRARSRGRSFSHGKNVECSRKREKTRSGKFCRNRPDYACGNT